MPVDSIYKPLPIDSRQSAAGGKINCGRFFEPETTRRICAAGVPTKENQQHLPECLQYYLIQNAAESLIHDAIKPPPPNPSADLRHAGMLSQVAQLINPPIPTKFETLCENLKCTTYNSYWNKELGQVRDPAPSFPEGFNIIGTTFGKPTSAHINLYDIITPKQCYIEQTPLKTASAHSNSRCNGPPGLIHGRRTYADKDGNNVKCCLLDERVVHGEKCVINSVKADFQTTNVPRVGTSLNPNDNVKEVPVGYSFGIITPTENMAEYLSHFPVSSERDFYIECFSHLNLVRRSMSTKFLPIFYHRFYLELKFLDKDKSKWLPKDIVYDLCKTKGIEFDQNLLEPLLSMWNAMDKSKIKYKKFLRILNNNIRFPELPKLPNLSEFLDYRTTYTEMVKPGQMRETVMAGLPSARYFDMDFPANVEGFCNAEKEGLGQESDVKCCLYPSLLTKLGLSHRDMYQTREPHVVRRVFEAAGETFNEELFNAVWQEAQKFHSEGKVCYETFRRALDQKVHSQNRETTEK